MTSDLASDSPLAQHGERVEIASHCLQLIDGRDRKKVGGGALGKKECSA